MPLDILQKSLFSRYLLNFFKVIIRSSFIMSYTYLLNLYNALTARITDIEGTLKDAPGLSANAQQHLAGRRDCLESIYQFLEEHYDHKLPRRLQGQSKKAR